jgi:hypothetical protein
MLPLNGSYMNRWIVDSFPDICLVDTHLGKTFVFGNTKKQKIVIIDNETVLNSDKFLPDYLIEPDNIYITKVNFFKTDDINEIKFCFFDIMEDIFALNHVKVQDAIKLIMPDDSAYSFLSLNRSVQEHRQILVNHLSKLQLLENSFVTYHRSNRKIKHLKKPNFDWYKNNFLPPDRVYNNFGEIPCTTNFLNYFIIKKEMQTSICLSAETDMRRFYPCEKSFLPLFTARIPIILSSKNHVAIMKNEGFDFFDDIVDNSYDQHRKRVDRIISAVDRNYDLLKRGIKLEGSLYKRCKKNFMHLKYDFFQKQLNDLKKYLEEKIL